MTRDKNIYDRDSDWHLDPICEAVSFRTLTASGFGAGMNARLAKTTRSKKRGYKIMNRFSFPANLTADSDDGGFVVTFPDLPEAITQGDSIEQCQQEATDCLEEAIAARIDDNLEIPLPSTPNKRELLVHLPLQTAIKATVYLAMREAGISKSELARRLRLDEKEVRRLLNPRHATKLTTLERALSALGKRAEIQIC